MDKKRITIGIVSNCVFEPYLSKYLKEFWNSDKRECKIIYYQSNDIDEHTAFFDIDMLIYWEIIYEKIQNIELSLMKGENSDFGVNALIADEAKKLNIIEAIYNGPIYRFSYENYNNKMKFVWGIIKSQFDIIDVVNSKIKELFPDQIIFDSQEIIAHVGVEKAYDKKGERRWGNPYSEDMLKKCAKEICKQYEIAYAKPYKCIVLDCDNVLWGGEISELGPNGIYLKRNGKGKDYYDFQGFIRKLYYNGIMLSICSKNDEESVKSVFSSNPDMLISLDMISAFKVNLKDKYINIEHISNELNISLDSMIFIDDSEYEIGAIKKMLPDVKCILFNQNSIYENLGFLNLSDKIDPEIVKLRNQTFKDNMHRKALLDQVKDKDYNVYLSKLETQVSIKESVVVEYGRISELTYRTNKCTLGTRFDIKSLKDISRLYTIRVRDTFGDLGIVGAIGISGTECNELILFCLSCRAIGRKVEEKMLEFIAQNFRITSIIFKNTNKNNDIYIKIRKTFLVNENQEK